MTKESMPKGRDAQRTRALLLQASQDAFARKGYAATGVREIAAVAGVNVALVSRYFGSKEGLYKAALADLLRSEIITSLPRDRFGEAVLELLTRNGTTSSNPLAMMVMASADPIARDITHNLLRDALMLPLEQWFGPEHGAEKAACFKLLSAGLTVYTQLYGLEILHVPLPAFARKWLINGFQSLVD